MAEKISRSEKVTDSATAQPTQRDEKAWRPKVHGELEANTNPFESFDYSGSSVQGASVNESLAIRDATKDTAPLQGSKDLSDDDSLEGDA